MTNYDHFHEAEDVWLVPGDTRGCGELWPILLGLGLELDDDVFTIDRNGKVPIWQSRSIVSVYVLLGEREVYEENGQWDRLKLRYLLATLPTDLMPAFVDAASAVSEALHIPLVYRGQPVTAAGLMLALESCANDLRARVGEPGSRDVAVSIKMSYPRPR